jgi:virulence factor Mce-like protein
MTGLRRRAAALVSVLVTGTLVLSGCSVYDAPLPGGADTGDDPIKVTAMFRDVLDLVPQSSVKVNDVTVGKVSEIKLKGYVAEVTLQLPQDTKLPDNATAQIRQTSLLGEKFVSLAPPSNPSDDPLSDKDVIGLDRTGRNPEVEEVFSALALLLNGGGVGQLKTIASEINTALDGREDEARSVLDQIRLFMTQLDQNKQSIVEALENTNRLAVQLRRQDGTIKSALDNIPNTLRSVNRQRDDLVKLLEALTRLSGVGVKVIRASKESTINSLRDLAPVLEQFADAGQNLPKALQVFLTYPFVDEAVGRDPQVARNLHMGDYTNLSVDLDLDVLNLPTLPTGPVCDAAAQVNQQVKAAADAVVDPLPNPPFDAETKKTIKDRVVERLLDEVEGQCRAPSPAQLEETAAGILEDVLQLPLFADLLEQVPGGLGGALDEVTEGLGGVTGGLTGGLPRAQLGRGYQEPEQIDPFRLAGLGLDPGIGTMLLQGVAEVR